MKVFNCLVIAVSVALACYMIANGNPAAAAVSVGGAALSVLITCWWPR